MGRLFKQYLNGPRIFCCAGCRTHAADYDDVVSKVAAIPSMPACLALLQVQTLRYVWYAGFSGSPRPGVSLQQRVSSSDEPL
jgi:hypothetical protein